ncbi:MAG: phosphoribulokinase, partial [Synechococcales bacterium]|nr:phosphoribulokinase [Synechococcales bacterium]
KVLRVQMIQNEAAEGFEPVYLFDEGSTIDWIPCGRKLTCSYPGIKMHYGPDTYYGNNVSVLEVDGEFDKLEEVIYIEKHLSNTSGKHSGEVTELLLQHREYPGSNNGTGLFQVLTGLKMRATFEVIAQKDARMVATTAR